MDIYNTKSDKIASLYWIHLKEHTDMFSEGYIGVSTEFKYRMNHHFSTLRHNKHENKHLQQAFNLYKEENLIIGTLLIGSEEYCYEVEEKLRPDKNIGWNINKGGFKPPNHKGRIKSEDEKRKISKSNTGKPRTPKTIYKIPVICPDGHIEIITNVFYFCKTNNVGYTSMRDLISNRKKSHKGYYLITEE